jgi:nucleotide-binding universal stress UspA family protein
MSLAKEIAKVANGFDLIVMGTNGEDNPWQDLFGSNTYRVIRNTEVPLLMIPEDCTYSEIRHIIFAYDYWRNDHEPVSKVVSFAKSLGARITIVQVMEAYSRDAEVELLALQEVIEASYSGQVNISFTTLYEDDIGEGVNQFAMRVNSDMLALCFRPGKLQKAFYSGIVRRVTTETAYPLLVIH